MVVLQIGFFVFFSPFFCSDTTYFSEFLVHFVSLSVLLVYTIFFCESSLSILPIVFISMLCMIFCSTLFVAIFTNTAQSHETYLMFIEFICSFEFSTTFALQVKCSVFLIILSSSWHFYLFLILNVAGSIFP